MSDLEKLIDDLCSRVDLHRVEGEKASVSRSKPAGDYALWTAEYAQVLLAQVERLDRTRLATVVGKWQDWFDDILGRAEGGSGVVDGYMVIKLSAEPLDELETVRQLELSTQVCRKHFIWPDVTAQFGWRGLMSISVLGLPDGNPAEEMTSLPALAPDVQQLWSDIEELGHGAVAHRDITKATGDDSD